MSINLISSFGIVFLRIMRKVIKMIDVIKSESKALIRMHFFASAFSLLYFI
ncbi:MAG: hypothetical protein ACRCVJ_10070 [Clostridium sp.]